MPADFILSFDTGAYIKKYNREEFLLRRMAIDTAMQAAA
jgi:hypothetical protein